METEHWQKADYLAQISADATQYHFHQLIDTLLYLYGDQESTNCPGWLKIRPSDWLSFPASDIRKVISTSTDKVEVESTFFGFYGVDAPLPQYFLQDITYQDEEGKRIQAFLDIFNKQAYWLLHQGWKKFHLLQQAGKANLFTRLATSLSGIYFERLNLSGWAAGALVNRCRSACAVEAILRQNLGLPNLLVDDQVISTIEVERGLALDGGQTLGEDTIVGNRVAVLGRAISIDTGWVSKEKAAQLRPGSSLGQKLSEVLEYYLPKGISYEVCIVLAPNQNTPFLLGQHDLCLGQPVMLGDDKSKAYRMLFTDKQYKREISSDSNQRYAA